MIRAFLIALSVLLSSQSVALTITINTTVDAACGLSSGSLITVTSGGTPPYTYIWNNGATTASLSNLIPGTYTVTVTDANLTTATTSGIVGSTSGIVGATITCDPSPLYNWGTPFTCPCKDQCNGTSYLRIDWMNGAPPFTVSTNPPMNVSSVAATAPYYEYGTVDIPIITNLCSYDTYTAIVTDANGCTGLADFFPTPNPPSDFSFNATITPACNGTNSGAILFEFLNCAGLHSNALSWTGPTPGSGYNGGCWDIAIDSLLPGVYDFTIWNEFALPPCDTTFSLIITDLGSNCGTVSGSVFLDSIPNCIADAGEPPIPSRQVRITPGPFLVSTDNSGNFSAMIPFGTYDLETVDNINFNSQCSVTGITLNTGNQTVSGIELGDSTGADLDLSVSLFAGSAQPGFTYRLYVQVTNHNYMTAVAPQVIIDYDAVLTFNSASVPFTVTGPAQVTLDFPSVAGFQYSLASVEFTVPPNPALIGTPLINNALLIANQPEINPSNNQFTLQQLIVGSFDPNDKAVWPASDPLNIYLVDIDSVFQYTIRFQNTGTATATKVVLVDTLNTYLDVTNFEVLGSSHACTWQISPQNILEVTYNNIMLPDSNANEPGSHGLFSFAIGESPALSNVTMPYILENTAAIYFDFNPPVITNTVFNTIDYSVGLQENVMDALWIHPNPATDQLVITSKMNLPVNRITVLDISGREVLKQNIDESRINISVASLQHGLYLIRIESGEHVYHKNFVKM